MYCEPWNAGKNSEARAVGRAIGRLMDSLDTINHNLIKQDDWEGDIAIDARALRDRIIKRLRAEGWRVRTSLKTDRWIVSPPEDV